MKYNKLGFAILVLLISCGSPEPSVLRVDTSSTTDISGRWNDTDAKLVAKSLISELLLGGWRSNFRKDNETQPVLMIGNIRNETMEHIDLEIISKDIEKELLNTGQVRLVATQNEREQIRQERQEQQRYASFETAKRLAQELGADFMLIGNISSIVDKSSGKASIYYTATLELVNVETNEKVWIGNKEIKKLVSRPKYY